MKTEKTYTVELVWNREFHFVRYGTGHGELKSAIKSAESIENSGDGARVKKTRILDEDGKIVWQHGRIIGKASEVK